MKKLIWTLIIVALVATGCASSQVEAPTTTSNDLAQDNQVIDSDVTPEAPATGDEMASEEDSTEEDATEEDTSKTTNTDDQELVLTLEELSAYNGENGMPAYIAVDGIIYDVTDSIPWSGGQHNGYGAGKDLTEAIKSAPHGTGKLDNVPIVGRIGE